ncbi:DUF3817 domain-containing protein [Sulfurimonas sp.]|nr:DUF3817 domain-containing protein [Sulfurimonas sp.]
MNNMVKNLGIINTTEGYSYLVLLFIAMPMKYMFEYPSAVKIAGMAHGVLFVLLCILITTSWIKIKWSWKESLLFFVASLIPFGTFYTRNRIKSYE